jgi:hypothetical protein
MEPRYLYTDARGVRTGPFSESELERLAEIDHIAALLHRDADAQHGILTAGPLPPHKVRIVMLLGLAHGMDGPAIQTWIDQILLAG